jgi:hypothetical protein
VGKLDLRNFTLHNRLCKVTKKTSRIRRVSYAFAGAWQRNEQLAAATPVKVIAMIRKTSDNNKNQFSQKFITPQNFGPLARSNLAYLARIHF